jgi:hypothetical protein
MTIIDEFIDEDTAIAILTRALHTMHRNPAARRAALAKLRESIAALRSPPPRTRLPEPKPIAPRFQQFYSAMAMFWVQA